MTAPATRDRAWLVVLAVSFAFGLAISWNRWGNPLIDTGREMNHPLRLAGGEMLYSDVRHVYGPLSPFLHAALFYVFGPSLAVLYADGIITAVAILALVYWLSRKFMDPTAAGAATLTVMWLCVFKPSGNYILPYSYNAVHGAALGLITLAILADTLGRTSAPSTMRFVLAGVLAGVTTLAKTEIGLAALAAGVTAAILSAGSDRRRKAQLAGAFVCAAVCVAGGAYAAIATRVGWSTLIGENWLLLYNVPPELAHYNKWISGFDDPIKSLRRIAIAVIKLGIVAMAIAAVSTMIAGGRRPWRLIAAALAIALVLALTWGLDPDRGPFLAMPVLLVGLLVMLIRGPGNREAASNRPTAILIVCSVYALASLARMILHVRSGGAYASYLLPVGLVMFTYLWVGPFANSFRDPRARRVASVIAVSMLVANAVAMAAVLTYRYRVQSTVTITSDRGTMIAKPDVGQAWNEALAYVRDHTRPGDAVAVLPEGTSINFLGERRNPLRDEIAIPGILDAPTESIAQRQLAETDTRLILITNRPTSEFGRAVFGRDYSQRLMRWIDANYTTCAMFGPSKDPRLKIGDEPFFIRAYCRSGIHREIGENREQ